MARTFEVPDFYRGEIVTKIKIERNIKDPKRKDLSPQLLSFDKIDIYLARHFGFCFGVENAIETAYKVVRENPGKRIFLLSEMIHNPNVNKDLNEKGVQFLMETNGKRLVDFSTLTPEDIVIIPAFGTTLETLEELKQIGIDPLPFNATCPFVEKVWKRSSELGKKGFTVIIHGKKQHEETKATFSHAKVNAPSLIVRDKIEAELACNFIKEMFSTNNLDQSQIIADNFLKTFSSSTSDGFMPLIHLKRLGVVNQTTMLASETIGIAQMFKSALSEVFGEENIADHYADTRDTLCYATNENQTATIELKNIDADFAIVVGGHNSSNTSHLVEILEEKIPTYFIKDECAIIDKEEIIHFDLTKKQVISTKDWYPKKEDKVKISLTAGASCPDKVIDRVITKLCSL